MLNSVDKALLHIRTRLLLLIGVVVDGEIKGVGTGRGGRSVGGTPLLDAVDSFQNADD